jgi:hypothetical protein
MNLASNLIPEVREILFRPCPPPALSTSSTPMIGSIPKPSPSNRGMEIGAWQRFAMVHGSVLVDQKDRRGATGKLGL